MRTLADRQRETAKADADDRELESRTDRRRQQDVRETQLKALAVRLVAAKAATLERLGLGEELLAAIATARAIRSAPARNRQVNVVRQHLRALGPGVEALLARLEAPRGVPELGPAAGSPPAEPAAKGEVEHWLERLASDADDALEELVVSHPNADRQLLRQRMRELVRARASAPTPSLRRAEARLREALGALLGA